MAVSVAACAERGWDVAEDWAGLPIDGSGGQWQVTRAERVDNDQPSPGEHLWLTGIAGLPSGEAWAAGEGPRSSVLLRWDGERWSYDQGPHRASHARKSVRVLPDAGRSECRRWIFGSTRKRVQAWCWNGRRWKSTVLSSTGRTGLRDVAVLDGDRLLASGEDFLKEWDGRHWRDMPAPSPPDELAVGSAGDIWGLWNDNTIRLRQGKDWKQTPVPRLSKETANENRPGVGPRKTGPWIHGIAPVTSNSVWAVGNVQRGYSEKPRYYYSDFVLHWNGRQWQRTTLGLKGIGLTHVTPDGRGGVWVATSGRYMLHHSAGRWSRVPLPAPAGSTLRFEALANVPGHPDTWAIAEMISERGSQTTRLILRYRQE